MALSDASSHADRMLPRRAVKNEGKHWSDSQKIECVSLYLTLGNLALTAATLKIPEPTVRKWRATEWWSRVENELKLQDSIQLSASAKRIVDKSFEAIADRLEHGDWIYDQKTGQMRRKPVQMRDAVHAAKVMMDQKLALDKVEIREQSTERIEDKLNKLMERFADMSAPKKIEVTDVVFGETSNAVHEKREEGLQAGERAVQQPSGTEESPFGTDDGSEGSD